MKKKSVSISILNFFNEDFTYSIISQISKLDLSDYDVTIIIGINRLSDDVSLDFFTIACNNIIKKNIILVIVDNNINIGFGEAHNKNLLNRSSDYFLILNNDIEFLEVGWFDKLLMSSADLVGMRNAPHYLLPNGCGSPDLEIMQYDYIEASCLLIKREVFENLGGFDNSFVVAYCEDSDLSLRAKMSGYRLDWVFIDHVHHRSSSAKRLPVETLMRITNINSAFFLSRWGWYLSRKRGLLIEIDTLGMGDIVNALHPLMYLRDLLGDRLLIKTNSLRGIFIKLGFNLTEETEEYEYHVLNLFSAESIEFRSHLNSQNQIYRVLGAKYSLVDNKFNLRQFFDSSELKRVTMHFDYERSSQWHGRGPDYKFFSYAASYFIRKGYEVVVVSKKPLPDSLICIFDRSTKFINNISLDDLFNIINSSEYVIAIDSLVFNIAQFFYKKLIVMFGPTLPSSRINRDVNVLVVYNEALDCLGCYNDPSAQKMNKCIFDQPRCESINIDEKVLEKKFDHFINFPEYRPMGFTSPNFAVPIHLIAETHIAPVNITISGRVALKIALKSLINRLKF